MESSISDRIYTYRDKIHRSTNERLFSNEQLAKRDLSNKNLVAVSGTSVDSNTSINNEPIEVTDNVPNYRILKRAVPFERVPVANVVLAAAESDAQVDNHC